MKLRRVQKSKRMTHQLYNSKNKEKKSEKNKSSPPVKSILAIIRAYALVETL